MKKQFPAEERSVEIFADEEEDDDDDDVDWLSHVSPKTSRMFKSVISALDDDDSDDIDIDDVSEGAALNEDYDASDDDNADDNDEDTPIVIGDGLGNVVTESITAIVTAEKNGVVVDIIDTVSANISDMVVTAEVEGNEWWGEEEGNNSPLAGTATAAATAASQSVTIFDDDDDGHDDDGHDDDGHHQHDSDNNNGHINNVSNDIIDKSITSSSNPSSSSLSSRRKDSVESHLHRLMTKSINHKSSSSIICSSSSDNSNNNNSSSSTYGNNTCSIMSTRSSGKQGRFNRSNYTSQPASLSTSVGSTCNLKNHR